MDAARRKEGGANLSDNKFNEAAEAVRRELLQEMSKRQIKLATVDSVVSGGLLIHVDGEDSARPMPYKRLASYTTPQAGDRIEIAPYKDTFIVQGKVI